MKLFSYILIAVLVVVSFADAQDCPGRAENDKFVEDFIKQEQEKMDAAIKERRQSIDALSQKADKLFKASLTKDKDKLYDVTIIRYKSENGMQWPEFVEIQMNHGQLYSALKSGKPEVFSYEEKDTQTGAQKQAEQEGQAVENEIAKKLHDNYGKDPLMGQIQENISKLSIGSVLRDNVSKIPCGSVIKGIKSLGNGKYNISVKQLPGAKGFSSDDKIALRKALDNFYANVGREYEKIKQGLSKTDAGSDAHEKNESKTPSNTDLPSEEDVAYWPVEHADGSKTLLVDTDGDGIPDKKAEIPADGGQAKYEDIPAVNDNQKVEKTEKEFGKETVEKNGEPVVGSGNAISANTASNDNVNNNFYKSTREGIDNAQDVFAKYNVVEKIILGPDSKTLSGTTAEGLGYLNTAWSALIAVADKSTDAALDFIQDGFGHVANLAARAGGSLGASMGAFSQFMPSIDVWPKTYEAAFSELFGSLEGREPTPNKVLSPLMDDGGKKIGINNLGSKVTDFQNEGSQ